MSSESVYKRCRPRLGTLAEVVLQGGDSDGHKTACEAAFAAIDAVDAAMSFHDPTSALSLLNAAKPGVWVTLPAALLTVLRLALQLQEDTCGIFHVGVANNLSARGLLPHAKACGPQGAYQAVPDAPDAPDDNTACFEVWGAHARRTQARRLDLGGIAKGYAVDAAIGAIAATLGARARGWVNIGGDLRVLGDKPPRFIMVRQPRVLQTAFVSQRLTQVAMATSSVPATPQVSPFVDTRRAAPWAKACTVVAQASSCMLADAFTKVGALLDAAPAMVLAKRYDVQLTVLP